MSALNMLSWLKQRKASKTKPRPTISAPLPTANAPEEASLQPPAAALVHQPDNCHFLKKLPAELRIKIYEYTFSDFYPEPTKLAVDYSYMRIRTASAPLIQVCRLIRNEAVGYYCNRLRQLDADVRQCHQLSSLLFDNHVQKTNSHHSNQQYDEYIDCTHVLYEMLLASAQISDYKDKITMGVRNKIGDLLQLGYWTGNWWAEDYLQERAQQRGLEMGQVSLDEAGPIDLGG
ncbi:hypothetical protein PRZ48_012583 [Zasmidium cellare]|uniref:Uncharacterized protein n=1 Tax=Zasmidium cellare TaxID=395010 RepID=A0ABR0E681_ZASCE|nr:hypothetical protein PRZ48_012583 [Zasmidium cellare]